MNKILVVACILITHVTSSYAQKQELPDQDLKEIEFLIKSVSDKIETTLKNDVALYTAMKGDIDLISQIKNATERKVAIEQYSIKYKKKYGQIVIKAGIDMTRFVSDLNAKYKKYTFTINNGYAILFSAKNLVSVVRDVLMPTEVKSIPISDFVETKEVDCFGLGYAIANFFIAKTVIAETERVGIGDCKASGQLLSTTTIPADAKSIILKIAGNTEASGYVVSAGGYAGGYSRSSVNVYVPTEGFISIASEIHLHAPLLWSAIDIAPLSYFVNTIDLTQFKGASLSISASAFSRSTCGGNAKSTFAAKSAFSSVELFITK